MYLYPRIGRSLGYWVNNCCVRAHPSRLIREASRARSDSEFCSKLDGLLQEADESALWLELLHDDCGITDDQMTFLMKETSELLAIFTTIVSKLRRGGA
jgi:four helix bundle protein